MPRCPCLGGASGPNGFIKLVQTYPAPAVKEMLWGPAWEGQGAGGAQPLPSSALTSPCPFQISREPCPWGWLTLDKSLTLSGPQFSLRVKRGPNWVTLQPGTPPTPCIGRAPAGNRWHAV